MSEHPIIDSDCHVWEPPDVWRDYLEPRFAQHALTSDLRLDGEAIHNKISGPLAALGPAVRKRNFETYGISSYDAPSVAKAVRVLGADVAFLYPSIGGWLFAVDSMDPALAGAFVRAYNNWLHDFVAHDPEVLRGVGAINRHAPEEMVPELQRIAAFGWRAVVLRPNPIKGRLLSDPEYEPFWSECERLDVAVALHEGAHARVPSAGADRFVTRFGLHACSHPMEQMMALLALIEGGVLERHPRLRVAFLEAGGGWIPYWLWRLDREYHDLQWEVSANVKMEPSKYFRRQCFVSIEPSEPYLGALLDFIGSDNIIIGSDFPHMDHDPNVMRDAMGLEATLSRDTVRKLLWDNPRRFYRL
ncbi:MAG TPA: amidohydrolase family protein [Thermoanaerobaculia bacterium]|jgi:predicted TIM-barrel fold metal-dependent hydrolase|nr:amidohydrolase family protein [Thermoanaerobaculia bacterium]